MSIKNADLTVDQKLVADAADVGGIGDIAQRWQNTGGHVGITSGAVTRVDDADKTIVGIDHKAGVHVAGFGGQIGAVAGVTDQIGCGFFRWRGQHQRRVDDVAEQHAAYFQPGLVGALAPLHKVAARDAGGQALIQHRLLCRGEIGEGQRDGGIAHVVPRLVNRRCGAGHDGRVSRPEHRGGIDRAGGGEPVGLDGAAPILGVVAGLVVSGTDPDDCAAGGAAPAGTGFRRDVAQR
ncbi:hypothetical protein D3C84_436310 [compost metagenome]